MGAHGIAASIFARGPGVGDDPAMTEAVTEAVSNGVASTTPLGRIGQPSDDSSYVTGQTIVVDGGLTSTRALAGQPLSELVEQQ